MLSHDAKMRCNWVDLYYTLYGVVRPMCLPMSFVTTSARPKKAGPPAPNEDDTRTFPSTTQASSGFLDNMVPPNMKRKSPLIAEEFPPVEGGPEAKKPKFQVEKT